MKGDSDVLTQTTFTDLNPQGVRTIYLAAIAIVARYDSGNVPLPLENTGEGCESSIDFAGGLDQSMNRIIAIPCPLTISEDDIFEIGTTNENKDKVILKAGPDFPDANSTPPTNILAEGLITRQIGGKYEWHPDSLITSGTPEILMNEGDYGIQGRSIKNEDKAIYRFSNSTQGTIIYCPGIVPPPTPLATWEVEVRSGTHSYTQKYLSPRFSKGTRWYAVPYKSDSYASLTDRTIPSLGKALGNPGYVGINNVEWREVGTEYQSAYNFTTTTTFDRSVIYPQGIIYRPLQGDTQITDLGFNIYLSDFVPNSTESITATVLGDAAWGFELTFSSGNGVLPRPGSYKFRFTELKENGTENVLQYYTFKEGSTTEYDTNNILDTITIIVPNPVQPYPSQTISSNDEETVRYLNNSHLNQTVNVNTSQGVYGNSGTNKDITLNTKFSLVKRSGFFLTQSFVSDAPAPAFTGQKWRIELMEYTP